MRTIRQLSWTIALALAVGVAAPASAGRPFVSGNQAKLTRADQRAIRRNLKPGEQPVLRSKMPGYGPGQAILVVTQDFNQRRAFALTRSRPGKGVRWQRTELPALHDYWVPFGQPAVVGGAKGRMAVMGQYLTGIGPTGAIPFNANKAVGWDARTRQFRTLPTLTRQIELLSSPQQVKKALAR
jgi:hypothetical protein